MTNGFGNIEAFCDFSKSSLSREVRTEAWLKCIKLEGVNHGNEPEPEQFQKEITYYWLDINIHAKQNQSNKQNQLKELQRKSKMFHKQDSLLNDEIWNILDRIRYLDIRDKEGKFI